MEAHLLSDGHAWERRSQRFLEAQGLSTIAANFRTKAGELDLIMLDGQQLVFVEVRKRSLSRFSGAIASVDWRKQQRLRRTAMLFLQRHRQWATYTTRFDVVAWDIHADTAGEPVWLKRAFA